MDAAIIIQINPPRPVVIIESCSSKNALLIPRNIRNSHPIRLILFFLDTLIPPNKPNTYYTFLQINILQV